MSVASSACEPYTGRMNTSLYCDKQLRGGDTCGLRPGHRGQHRGSKTLSYCDGCDRPYSKGFASAHASDGYGDIAASFCFMCARGIS